MTEVPCLPVAPVMRMVDMMRVNGGQIPIPAEVYDVDRRECPGMREG